MPLAEGDHPFIVRCATRISASVRFPSAVSSRISSTILIERHVEDSLFCIENKD